MLLCVTSGQQLSKVHFFVDGRKLAFQFRNQPLRQGGLDVFYLGSNFGIVSRVACGSGSREKSPFENGPTEHDSVNPVLLNEFETRRKSLPQAIAFGYEAVLVTNYTNLSGLQWRPSDCVTHLTGGYDSRDDISHMLQVHSNLGAPCCDVGCRDGESVDTGHDCRVLAENGFSNIRPKALGVTLVTLSSRYDQHYAQAHY